VQLAGVCLRSNSLRVINETADFSRHRRQHRPKKDIPSWPLGFFALSLSFASSLQQDIFAQLNEGAEGTQRGIAKGYSTVRFF